jgi:hypothetical protein
MVATGPQRDRLIHLCDGGQIEMVEAAVLEKVADEIVDMQALHDDHDRILGLVVEPGQERIRVPLPKIVASGLGLRLLGLEGIVDDQEVAATARSGCRRPRLPI